MGRALLYYELHSRWNRLRSRLQRLRQPKYLLGALVGGLYFYWYVFSAAERPAAGRARRCRRCRPEHLALLESLAALVLLVVLLLMWIIPHERAALMFTEAEVAFLFPAPVGRRTLIHFKLLKSQSAIFFSALFMTLIGRWGGGHYLFRAIGWWGLLSIVNLHLLGSSFAAHPAAGARDFQLAAAAVCSGRRGIGRRRRHPLGCAIRCRRRLIFQAAPADPSPRSPVTPGRSCNPARCRGCWRPSAGPSLRCLRRTPENSSSPSARCWASSRCIICWVIRSNVAFEEASVELSRKFAERIAAVRSGNWQADEQTQKGQAASLCLAPGRLAGRRHFLEEPHQRRPFLHRPRLVLSDLDHGHRGRDHAALPAGIRAEARPWRFWRFRSALMSLLYGPAILRHDFRQDLRVADILKLFPMPGWQVVLGEILAPAAILAGAQWALLLLAFLLCPANVGGTPAPMALRHCRRPVRRAGDAVRGFHRAAPAQRRRPDFSRPGCNWARTPRAALKRWGSS